LGNVSKDDQDSYLDTIIEKLRRDTHLGKMWDDAQEAKFKEVRKNKGFNKNGSKDKEIDD